MKKMMKLIAVMVCIVSMFSLTACIFSNPEIDKPFDGDGSEHTVTFESNGGSAVESARVRDGNLVLRPKTPEKEGYFLIGWFEDEALADERDFDRDRVSADLRLYAVWQENKNVQPTQSLEYEKEGNAYTVVGVGEETVVVIPDEYQGLPVTKIQGQNGTGAFARKAITSVSIPDSITEIGKNSFYNCAELVTVEIGEGSALDTIGNNAFSGCRALASFYLPAGVTTIGDSAFNNCAAIDFAVDGENIAYRSENGHLIERATETLIRGGQSSVMPNGVKAIAQAAFRRASAITELSIPFSVVSIGNYVVSDSTIATIIYHGSESAWNEVEKGRMWNSGNKDIIVEFVS